MKKYSGQSIAVLGCATSGIAAARLAKKLGAEVTLLDSSEKEAVQNRAAAMREEGFATLLGNDAETTSQHFDLVVLSPGIDPSWKLAQHFISRGMRCIGELEFAYQNSDKPIIAITGTNGKTTTTELIERLLLDAGTKTVAGANYGVAFSELIYNEVPVDIYTLEVSSFQMELIEQFHAKVALWLNFAADHLDRHPDMEAYRNAKLRIFENQKEGDVAIVNKTEADISLNSKKITFSAFEEGGDYHFKDGKILLHDEVVLDMADIQLRGLHNVENIMAAMAAAHAVGVSHASMIKTLAAYKPARHRCELVATINGREFINDSKATNLHATESALRGFENPVILIAGGKQKGLDYAPMTDLVAKKATHVFSIGEIRHQLVETWGNVVSTTPCDDLETAVNSAYAASSHGQSILFSPGTSSFDMFTGYDHRGNVFCDFVHKLQVS